MTMWRTRILPTNTSINFLSLSEARYHSHIVWVVRVCRYDVDVAVPLERQAEVLSQGRRGETMCDTLFGNTNVFRIVKTRWRGFQIIVISSFKRENHRD